jgi:O-antigen ligase/tetratricopeptide (TPR) repeat protein
MKSTQQSACDRACRRAVEFLLAAMIVGAPWGLGGTHPLAIVALQITAGLVLALWAARLLLTRSVLFRPDGAVAALAGITLFTGLQLIPLPESQLQVVSPHTLETNKLLRPAIQERLADEMGPDRVRAQTFPVSLSPPDTREFFTQSLLITLLYAAARSNWGGPASVVRLAWLCAINGALLGLLAIGQRLSSPPTVIYWSIPVENTVAGPFVNRNHLPDYALVCLGLGCALLAPRFRGGFGEIINRPSALWLLAIVGATGAGIAVSQSRGGVVAALVAIASTLIVWLRHAARASGLLWMLCAAIAVAAIGSWIGWSAMATRLGTVEASRQADETRSELWEEGLTIFTHYPWFGTGNGTFNLVEPSYRTHPGRENESAEYAHNEYIEALAEGGVVRLGLTLVLVCWPLVRLVRRHRAAIHAPGSEFLLAGFFGLLALAAHSVVDFGLHLPAIAVLATVFLAAVMAVADVAPSPVASPHPVLAGGAALVLLVLAGLIGWDGLTAYRAEQCRSATVGMTLQGPPSLPQAERAVRLMSAASAARPGNALYSHELGQAYLARALNRPAGSAERQADLQEALRHWRTARDGTPLMSPTQARLGRYRDLFASADPALLYYERARSLLPTDATMIYYCGQARWDAGDVAGACADWRASLSIAPVHLVDILGAVRSRLAPDVILRDVLPDQPERILAAADNLFANSGPSNPARRAYLERALSLIGNRAVKEAADWDLEARLESALGHPDRAAAAYRQAVGLAPRNTSMRLAYSRALHRAGALSDCRRELETVLAQEPGNRTARDQLDVVIRELQLQGKD